MPPGVLGTGLTTTGVVISLRLPLAAAGGYHATAA
jgi:hypothetical protein